MLVSVMSDFILRVAVVSAIAAWFAGPSPCALAEDRTWAVRGEFVRLKAGAEDTVLISLADGTTVELPLRSLGESDRIWLTEHQRRSTAADGQKVVVEGPLGRSMRLDVPPVIAEVERNALFCNTATEAALVYDIFLARASVPPEAQLAAEARRGYWLGLSKDNRIRFGEEWISLEEQAQNRREADGLLKHCRELVRLNNPTLALDDLKKLSRLAPEDGRADFYAGLLNAYRNEWKQGEILFREVIRREPRNGWAFNNLAICEIFKRESLPAVEHFRRAIQLLPIEQIVADNIAIALKLATQRKVSISEKTMRELNELYRRVLSDFGLKQLEPNRPHELLFFLSPYGPMTGSVSPAPPKFVGILETPEEITVATDCGAGFVIAPGYILTTFRLVDGVEDIAIIDRKMPSRPMPATVVASAENSNLTLLRCQELDSPSLALAPRLPPPGTPVMACDGAGDNRMALGVRSAIGSLAVLPTKALGDSFLHTATFDKCRGGGPVIDKQGMVVGLSLPPTPARVVAQDLARAIPAEELTRFLGELLPEAQARSTLGSEEAWEAVEKAASQSTVFIETKRRIFSPTAD